MVESVVIPPNHQHSAFSWRYARRCADLLVSLYLLAFLFGYPMWPGFGVPYGCKRHADPVMREAIERGRLVEQVRHLEAIIARLSGGATP